MSRELIYYLINMENLTKHQLILVALLISFVTSIATGIVTVSLMDQAPKGVTQTINRVVERTVERVVTEPPKKGGAVVKETIVVKEEDKIIEAIEKNAKSMVRIYKVEPVSTEEKPLKSFVGLGIIISKEGDIVTDSAIISETSSYSVVLNDSKEYKVSIKPSSKEKQLIEFLKIIPKEKEVLSLTIAVLADSDTLKMGQTVISLGGKLRNSVSIGVITSFVELNNSSSESSTPETVALGEQELSTTTSSSSVSAQATQVAAAGQAMKENIIVAKGSKENLAVAGKGLTFIETNIVPSDNVTGNPLINLSSEVIGIRVKALGGSQTVSFAPINEVRKIFYNVAESTSSAKQSPN